MNWEDSALSDEEIRRVIGKDRKLKTVEDLRVVFNDVAKAQAKYTGDIAYKQGIRTVVEWIESVKPITKLPEGNMKHYAISIEQWQAFLKEQGVE